MPPKPKYKIGDCVVYNRYAGRDYFYNMYIIIGAYFSPDSTEWNYYLEAKTLINSPVVKESDIVAFE